VAQIAADGRSSKPRRGPVRAAIVALRPQEWVKNLLVFAGLLFSGKFDDVDAILAATLTFVAFCMVASAGYMVNDARDIEEDRQHPTKRNRPIAAGELGIPTAIGLAVVLAIGGPSWIPLSGPSCSPTRSAPRSTRTCSSTR
jgi:decaprenyl-phosphate phosphoribosyltransferase